MAFSYSSAAKNAQTNNNNDNNTDSPVSSSIAAAPSALSTSNQPSPYLSSSSSSSMPTTPITHLILDAGPLLSLSPLRHLATHFHTTPFVLAELRDPRAREHWNNLGLSGVNVSVQQPSAEAMRRVVEFAKKTGDYAVLSLTDLSVVALTCQWELEVNGDGRIRKEPGEKLGTVNAGERKSVEVAEEKNENEDEEKQEQEDEEEHAKTGEKGVEDAEESKKGKEPASEEQADETSESTVQPEDNLTSGMSQLNLVIPTTSTSQTHFNPSSSKPNDEDDESDGGEWITPFNLKAHRSHDLGLLPDDSRGGAAHNAGPLAAACMTGDYAVQNVLLGMGLGLVGEGGKRIAKVRSWVLRCHACFKLCKDPSKKFCPSCGNATLLRTTITTSATTGKQTIHLKKNFQYHLRGTKYSIPDPKPGRAKGQQKSGSGLILREDQAEWQDAVKSEHRIREKEERKAMKGDGGWNDPDWLPEIITVGTSGKGRSGGHGMPSIGHGRKNPNQSRRKR